MSLTRVSFGVDPEGRDASAFVLRSPAGIEVWLLEWGATLARVLAPDREGRPGDVVLGFDDLHDFRAPHPYFGAVVGRHANRIRGSRFPLDGRVVRLEANDGEHHLHGGPQGFDRRTWQAAVLDEGDAPAIEFGLRSEAGDQGYPGALEARVTYRLGGNMLQLEYLAASDAPTPVNLTQHAYFDLSGSGDIRAQHLRVPASRYLPVDATLLPTGELRDVAGTPFDFRDGPAIGERLAALAADESAAGFDHCFVLDGAPGCVRLAAEVLDPASGRLLRLYTDQPGLQVYTGNFLDGSLRGRGGVHYARHAGLCLEAQRFPDGPNQPRFPDPILRPGQVYRQSTVMEFGLR